MKRQRNESGQVILVLAIGMVALLAFAALAIDGGNIYTNRRVAQNTADAASFAGSQKLAQLCGQTPPSNDWTQIRGAVQQFVTLNGGALGQQDAAGTSYSAYFIDSQGNRLYGDLTIEAIQSVPCGCNNGQSVGYQATGVEVVVNKRFNSFLAGVIGRSQSEATATAKANYGVTVPTSSSDFKVSDIYPLAVPTSTYYVGQDIQLFDDTPGPGNFGWLAWRNVNDAPALRNSLGMGNAPTYAPLAPDTVANYVNPDTGAADAPLTIGKRASGAPGLANGTVSQLFGKTIVVPMYDPNPQLTNGQGSHYNYYITGWLAIELYEYDKQGQHSYMKAIVKQAVTQKDWSSSASTCSVPLFRSEKVTH
jgi:Flp pilus assembly protein TadG